MDQRQFKNKTEFSLITYDLENVDKTDKVERRRSSREKRPVERRRLYRQALVQPKKKRVEQSKKKKGKPNINFISLRCTISLREASSVM
uniref:Uncharacterized protein n=1 Tax=Helianthus annuus TaxID=4232 RepID=A0A251VQJ5_HELAN